MVLSQANFRVVKQVSVTYIYTNQNTKHFNANQLKESAYAALVKKAGLTGAQTIINVTMEQIQRESHNFWTALFFAPKYQQAILVSGTVIEFLPEGVTPNYSDTIESSVVYANPFESNHDIDNSIEPQKDAESTKVGKTKGRRRLHRRR